MVILVTGCAGFIGSNFVLHLLRTSAMDRVINLDKLTYAGNLRNLASIEDDPRYSFVHGSVADPAIVDAVLSSTPVDAIVHFAAESHVDRSIEDASVFLETNVIGTQVMLDAALHHGIKRYVQISTDEVYGSLGADGAFTETSPLSPNSPYAASKAAADLLVGATFHTHGLPAMIVLGSNNYGAYQFPEKLIPLTTANALRDEPVPVYGDGRQVRDWLYVEDFCRAIELVLTSGTPGQIYNVGGNAERENLDVVETILDLLGKPRDLIRFVEDRPGHDRRYAMDYSKINNELRWAPSRTFDQGLASTVAWYRDNSEWLEKVRSGKYMEYYERMYGQRPTWLNSVSRRPIP